MFLLQINDYHHLKISHDIYKISYILFKISYIILCIINSKMACHTFNKFWEGTEIYLSGKGSLGVVKLFLPRVGVPFKINCPDAVNDVTPQRRMMSALQL